MRRIDRVLVLATALLLLPVMACAGPEAPGNTAESLPPADSGPTSEPADSPVEGAEAEASTRLPGIDVSQFQGEIDWQAVKASGVVFAVARALEGETIHDSQFAANWQGMKEAGLVRGAYDFYVADDPPAAQVQIFSGLVTLEPGDLRPLVDIEQGSIGSSAPADLVANFHTYLELMEQQFGAKPIIYTNPSFWNEFMDDSFGAYPLWVAEYDVDSPTLPGGWDSWVLWQHSESGSVPGIDGAVDLDTFNGGLEELARYRVP